jgi:trans-aconitate methyltransferase
LPSWDGAAYAGNTAHHRVHDADFLATTPLRPTDRVLDLGCGAGDLTATIAGLVPDGHVVGVDAQPSMLDEARSRQRPNQTFVLAAVQDLPDLGAFDVVLSRAVLHWVPRADWPAVLAGAAARLRPGGWLRVECGGAGNVPKVVEALGAASGLACPWTFLDAGEALELLEAAGLDAVTAPAFVRTVGQRRPFDDETFAGWLHSQALQAYEASLPADSRAAFRGRVDSDMDAFRRADGTLDQTYVRLDLLARRP